jgi:hypothetical protein
MPNVDLSGFAGAAKSCSKTGLLAGWNPYNTGFQAGADGPFAKQISE